MTTNCNMAAEIAYTQLFLVEVSVLTSFVVETKLCNLSLQ